MKTIYPLAAIILGLAGGLYLGKLNSERSIDVILTTAPIQPYHRQSWHLPCAHCQTKCDCDEMFKKGLETMNTQRRLVVKVINGPDQDGWSMESSLKHLQQLTWSRDDCYDKVGVVAVPKINNADLDLGVSQ